MQLLFVLFNCLILSFGGLRFWVSSSDAVFSVNCFFCRLIFVLCLLQPIDTYFFISVFSLVWSRDSAWSCIIFRLKWSICFVLFDLFEFLKPCY